MKIKEFIKKIWFDIVLLIAYIGLIAFVAFSLGSCEKCDEPTQTEYDVIYRTEPASYDYCPYGGKINMAGQDIDEDFYLDEEEVEFEETVCNSKDYVNYDVPSGISWQDKLDVEVSPIYNKKCGTGNVLESNPFKGWGGKRILLGFADGEGIGLEDENVVAKHELCHTSKVTPIITNVTYLYPNNTCVDGGYFVQIGEDLDGNGFLDEPEKQITEVICITKN